MITELERNERALNVNTVLHFMSLFFSEMKFHIYKIYGHQQNIFVNQPYDWLFMY